MTNPLQKEIETLLKQPESYWQTADGLLTGLASMATGSAEEQSVLKDVLAGTRAVAWDDAASWVEDWPSMPTSPDGVLHWLAETEMLGLVEIALKAFGDTSPEAVRLLTAVQEQLIGCAQALASSDTHFVYAGEAEKRAKDLGFLPPPWSFIEAGSAAAQLAQDDASLEPLCALWFEGRLHSEDAAQLRQLFPSHRPLAAALQHRIAEATTTLRRTQWNPAWTPSVAQDELQLDAAAVLLRCPLPHIESDLVVRHHVDGSHWTIGTHDAYLVAADCDSHRWSLPDLGSFSTRMGQDKPDAATDVWHGLRQLDALGDTLPEQRVQAILETWLAALEDGVLGRALEAGHKAFEEGLPTSREQELLVGHALQLRLQLPDAIDRSGLELEAQLFLHEQLDAVDTRHATHGSALFLIEDERYQQLSEDEPLDYETWWGKRALLDEAVPEERVEQALDALHREQMRSEQENDGGADIIAFVPRASTASSTQIQADEARGTMALAAQSAKAPAASTEAPCSWLKPAPSTTSNDSEHPAPDALAGCVPLLLYRGDNKQGVLAELRVTVAEYADEKAVWAKALDLKRLARSVIRTAYYEAAGQTPWGAPPFDFARHRFELIIDPGVAEQASRVSVDGRSVGLPAALAFASAWLGQSLPKNLAAVGTVSPGGWVGAVGAVTAKTRCLAALVDRSDFRVLCAQGNAEQVREGGIEPVVVEKLADALAKAKFELGRLDGSCFGSISARKGKLDDLVRDIKNSALDKHGAECTWRQLGDKTRRLIDSLKDEPGAGDLNEARCHLALAYTHAGMLGDVDAALRGVTLPVNAPRRIKTLFHIVRLGKAIDAQALESAEGHTFMQQVASDLDDLRQESDPELHGRAAGTLGRAYMHANRLAQALPLLREGVSQHLAHQPHEVGRSRIYLAMALRRAGEAQAALDELVQAAQELETHTRRWSEDYARDTRMYLDYEMARTLVSLERFDEAISCGMRALRRCAWIFWPQLGVRRTLAWALRMTDRPDEADQHVEKMRASFIPAGHQELGEKIIAEAEGYPIEDGEIY